MLGRFISPDTAAPDRAYPQSFNRYTYAYNNPLRFIDPSGHCNVDSNGNIERYDCTDAEFEALSAQERIAWMQAFMALGYDGWFNNIIDIIVYFSQSTGLQQMRSGSWASWADAGVLAAIQNGYQIVRGTPQSVVPGTSRGPTYHSAVAVEAAVVSACARVPIACR